MPTISILPNGCTSGNIAVKPSEHMRAKRKETKGWTTKVSSSLKKWFYSIPIDTLNGHGYSFTLTLKDCPDSSDDWALMRNAYIKRLFRTDCIRLQWITEWQRRGVPHLHGVAYFETEKEASLLINHWVDVAKKHSPAPWAQDVKPIHDISGWLNYLAKHAARGASHYQRSADSIPEGWLKTGRMWGYRGDWIQQEAMKFSIDQQGFNQFRRIVKNYYHAQMRDLFANCDYPNKQRRKITRSMIPEAIADLAPEDKQKLITDLQIGMATPQQRGKRMIFLYSRHALKNNNPDNSRMMGTSDWMPMELSTKLLIWMGGQGYRLHQY